MNRSVVIAALFIFLVSACGGTPSNVDEPQVIWGQAEQELAQASGRFGLSLFSKLAEEDQDNLFFSPLSISMALGMPYLGARGATAEAFERTLQVEELTPQQIRQGYRNLLDALPRLDKKMEFQMANSVWYEKKLPLLKTFVRDVSDTFDAPVKPLDFLSPSAVKTINQWVDDNTNGKIDSIVDRLNPMEVMVLANAVYFDATWTVEFDPQDTWEQVFETPGGEKTVPLMYLHGNLDYLENDTFQAVRLPYGDSRRLAMTVLLPQPEVPIGQVISNLAADGWHGLQQQFKERSGHLWLPRCEIRYKNEELLPALRSMGLTHPGDPDYSGISEEPLWLSRVLHKAYLKIDETGTEAAATTAVIMDGGCATPDCSDTGEFYLRADRPFVVVIHDQPTGSLLFMGRISDP